MSDRTLSQKLLDNRVTRPIIEAAVKQAVSHLSTRTFLNRLYNKLEWKNKNVIHSRFGGVFIGVNPNVPEGHWSLNIAEKEIVWPIRRSTLALDWGLALATLGHDAEVKETYLSIIQSELRPHIFLDVGANFGTHSVLMSTLGLTVIAFEPNPVCREYAQAIIDLNELAVRWEPVALGDQDGDVTLTFPEGATWLGTIHRDYLEKSPQDAPVIEVRVPLKRLDSYAGELRGKRILIKLDVEGAELDVLSGADLFLRELAPLIIFESNYPEERRAMYGKLSESKYKVYPLPWNSHGAAAPFAETAFEQAKGTNFIAIPQQPARPARPGAT